MACEDCEKVTKKYVKACQACGEKEEDAHHEMAEDQGKKTDYAAEFCC